MLTRIKRIIQDISHADTLKEAMQIMVEYVAETLSVDACSVFLVHAPEKQYVLLAHVGLELTSNKPIVLQTGQGLVGWVAMQEEPLNVENAPAHPYYHAIPEMSGKPFYAFLGVPIMHHGKVLGVLVTEQHAQCRLSDTIETFLMTLSTQLANVIANGQITDALLSQTESSLSSDYLSGIAASSGIGIGEVVSIYPCADLTTVPKRMVENCSAEIELFEKALAATKEELEVLAEQLSDKVSPEELALFDAYLKMLTSPSLNDEVKKIITSGTWAQGAWCQVIQQHIAQFTAMDNEYMQARAVDVRDLGQRVLAHLQMRNVSSIHYPDKTILVGEEVTATNLASVPLGKLVGIVSLKGSRHSHVAILARAMDIPIIMAVTGLVPHKVDGKRMIVVGHLGHVYLDPSVTLQQEFVRLQEADRLLNQDLVELANAPAITPDGHEFFLSINAGLVQDVPALNAVGAVGIGLYRTEIMFMIRDSFPNEAQQYAIYQKILRDCHPLPVAIRTLDIGGDKALPYFTITEDNPFLGWRGIRVALDHPEIFLMQVRAMLRASVGLNNLHIILPMISHMQELLTALGLINRAWYEVSEMCPSLVIPKIGAMIEVPAAVYQAHAIAAKVDFLSIGTNDLTQYLLAVDRNNPRVADIFDHLHPAVLSAIQQTVQSGHAANREVMVCGEMAADPLAVMLLMAFGVDGLSMNANSVLKIKSLIRALKLSHAKILWQDVKGMTEASSIRLYLENALNELGLKKLL